MYITVLHDDDAVREGHRFGLVMGDIHKGCVDTLTELDDLRAHFVSELRVQVGERLVHQEYFGVSYHSSADGDALALTAGESLGLSVKILGDAEDVGDFLDLCVNVSLGSSLELQSKRHVVADGHVRIQRVVLENHRDISVLGDDVVHQVAVDVQLAFGDVLKTRDHAQSGGLTAAGRTDQNDEFLVLDVQVDVMHGGYFVVIDFLDSL